MKSILSPVVLALALAGCMSAAPKAPTHWTLNADPKPIFASATPKFGIVRLAQVSVRSPYDGSRLVVLRKDGSVAFDAFNSFAAQPAALLKGTAHDILEASGLFEKVMQGSSQAQTKLGLEITVNRLALDCTREGERKASVALAVVLMDGRTVVSSVHGEGSAPATDGNYSSAFSTAFTSALVDALMKL